MSICQHYSDLYNKKRVDLHLIPIVDLLLGDLAQARKHFKKTLKSMNLESAKVIIASSLFTNDELSKTDKFIQNNTSCKFR